MSKRVVRAGLVLPALLVGCSQPTGPGPDVPITEAVIAANDTLGNRPDVEVTAVRRSLTADHVRYRRLAPDGTYVADSELVVTLEGTPGRWTGRRVAGDTAATPPRLVGALRLSQTEAETAARSAITTGTLHRLSIERVALPIVDHADEVRPGYRAIVETRAPDHGWEVWIDGRDGTAEVRRDTYRFANGTGFVFDPNPVMQTGNVAIPDNNDATSPTLDAARKQVTLARLDGTSVLRGTWVDSRPTNANQRATSATHDFRYTRNDDRFEEVMAYYHVDAAQQRLQALGFTGVRGANARVQVIVANGTTADNSFYSPSDKEITMGSGGVDDGEDADVIVHEYGHAVQDDIVPGWGASTQAGAMGEGFGDLLAASVLPVNAANVPMISRACIASWDAVSYDNRNPPCLRRIDEPKHYPEDAENQVHADGEIWSAGAWDIYTALNDPGMGLQLVVESFFSLTTTATFQQWSESMIAADTALHGGAHVAAIKRALWARGLYRTPVDPIGITGMAMTATANAGAGPLANNADGTVTIEHPGAGAIKVHFDKFQLQTNRDFVYVFDGAGVLYGIYTGNQGAHDGPVVAGSKVVLRYVTNASNMSQGFHVDRYEYGMPGAVPDGAPVDAAVTPADAAIDAPGDAAVAPDDADVPADGDVGPSDGPINPGGPDAGGSGPDDDGEGGCCDTNQHGSSALLAFALGALMLRRRRR